MSEFYSLLSEEHVTEEDYKHAQHVWKVFDCQTMGDYHDLYMKSDVLLLADVFENFRAMAIDTYKLDPAHYYTAPGLAWDSMLRCTGVQLKLLEDLDMYLMLESGIRGGVSVISKKWAKANNHYTEDYDPSKTSNYLMYLDANNLYGWGMSQKMPYDNFEWVEEEQLSQMDVSTLPEDADTGYIFEVDLSYPQSIHNLHSDYPLAPESRTAELDDLSPCSARLREKINVRGRPQPKLMTTLHDKEKYVVHLTNLKLYMRLGMKLTKVHRAVRFSQSYWLRDYIMLNTRRRMAALNAFEKDFYKLMNKQCVWEDDGECSKSHQSRIGSQRSENAEVGV